MSRPRSGRCRGRRLRPLLTRLCLELLEDRTLPTAGLVAAYGFGEAGGAAAVLDASGGGNNGTVSGAVRTAAGRFGPALSFNGASDWVTVPDSASLHLAGAMTLEAWALPTSPSNGWATAVLKERPGGLAYALYAADGAGRPPAGYVNRSGTDYSAAGTATLPLNAWSHLAVTYNGSALRLYVNGTQVGTRSVSGTITASTGLLRIGGNGVWGEFFAGVIDEVRVYNRALSQAEIQTDMSTPVDAPAAPDATPPTVALTSPAGGATVSGTVVVTASASDDVGVVGVQFLLNGSPLGAEDTTSPYGVSWDTTAVPNSPYALSARARDAAGNTATSAAVPVTVANSGAAAQVGQWSAVTSWPLVAINMVLLHTGKVLTWDGGPDCIGWSSARLWDPATNTFTAVPVPNPGDDNDIFCAGNAVLADGRVLVVGGHDCSGAQLGTARTNVFDPVTQQWTRLPDMAYARWYPTATTLPDGRVLATAGSDLGLTTYIPIPEVFNPLTNTWARLTGAGQTIPNYPFMFVLPDGRVLEAGSDEATVVTRVLNLATQTWTTVDPVAVDGGSAVMYLPGKVLKAGSSSPQNGDPTLPSAATSYVLDMTQASPAWRQTASMANPRSWLDLTVLPDGTVLATGGSRDLGGTNPARAVYPAELWSPATETWTTMASMQTPRLYHSSALLLPDGRVLVAGGGHNYVTPADYFSAEIYSPPYLFRGARPTVTAAPAALAYGSGFFVQTPDAASIASVALVRPGAVTHAFDEDQRFVPLSFTQTAGGLTVQAPANANLAPPGYYMLFLVNSNGVPSVAPFVRLPAPYEDTQPPTAPASLTAAGSLGSVGLSWSAATDNVGVTGYDVYRATVAGFTPSAANRVGQTAGTSYTDSGLAAGTYYYRVTARDAAGNVSAPSAEASATATADTTAPTVALTSPAGGATVSGTVNVSASASDDVGVVGVQFLLNGAPLGAEDTTAPYSVSWNTTTVANGSYTLTARARDAAGNQTTSAAVTVTVANAAPSGLVAAYGFSEGSGASTADASGNALTGTISGATWTDAGKFGRALSFNGTGSWVTVNDNNLLDLTNRMTLEAWVKPTALNGWTTAIMKERSGGLAYALYASDDASRPPAGYVNRSGTDYSALGTSTLPLNTWTHLAVTYDGATLRLYVNGVQAASRALTGSMTTSGSPLRFGGNAVWGEYFSGLLDEVRVYSRALSQAEIQQDMNTPVDGAAGAPAAAGGPSNGGAAALAVALVSPAPSAAAPPAAETTAAPDGAGEVVAPGGGAAPAPPPAPTQGGVQDMGPSPLGPADVDALFRLLGEEERLGELSL